MGGVHGYIVTTLMHHHAPAIPNTGSVFFYTPMHIAFRISQVQGLDGTYIYMIGVLHCYVNNND